MGLCGGLHPTGTKRLSTNEENNTATDTSSTSSLFYLFNQTNELLGTTLHQFNNYATISSTTNDTLTKANAEPATKITYAEQEQLTFLNDLIQGKGKAHQLDQQLIATIQNKTISKNTKEEDDNKFAPNLKAATTCYRTLICLLLKYNQSISIAMNQDVSDQQSNTNSNTYLVLLSIWKTAIEIQRHLSLLHCEQDQHDEKNTVIEMQANTMYTETVFILPMTESVAGNVSK